VEFTEIVAIAVGLAMDAFAVSVGAATSGFISDKRAVFRLSFHFGLFQFMMPVIGWTVGIGVASLIHAADHWIAFGLLSIIGGRMIYSGIRPEAESYRTNPSKGWSLVMLSLATSIDALAVGLSLAMLQVNILYPSVCVGVITAGLSIVGIRLGHKSGQRYGTKVEIIGGVLLFLIGLRILIEHLHLHYG